MRKEASTSLTTKQTLELVEHYKENQDAWLQVRKNAVQSVQGHTYRQRAEYILGLMQKYWLSEGA